MPSLSRNTVYSDSSLVIVRSELRMSRVFFNLNLQPSLIFRPRKTNVIKNRPRNSSEGLSEITGSLCFLPDSNQGYPDYIPNMRSDDKESQFDQRSAQIHVIYLSRPALETAGPVQRQQNRRGIKQTISI